MKKCLRRTGFCLLLAALVWSGTLFADRQQLNEELIRLHVLAASDSPEDQRLKLRVRDAVLESLREELGSVGDVEQAKAYLLDNLQKLEEIADQVLALEGSGYHTEITLTREAFDSRGYASFRLPAGLYHTLKITIGRGEGANWWCVIFPDLSGEAVTEEFRNAAVGAGFPEGLSGALTGEAGSEIRFFLLEILGKLENLLYGG